MRKAVVGYITVYSLPPFAEMYSICSLIMHKRSLPTRCLHTFGKGGSYAAAAFISVGVYWVMLRDRFTTLMYSAQAVIIEGCVL